MLSNILSPGVVIDEKDYSEYVSETSTCYVGLVGGAKKGPLTPTLVTNQADFIKIFGTPTRDDYGAYSALAVLDNADVLYYQRAIHGTPTKGSTASAPTTQYVATEDASPVEGKTYYVKDGDNYVIATVVYSRYVVTSDESPVEGKTYYTKNGDNYVEFTGETFEEEVTYYEHESGSEFTPGTTYYELEEVTVDDKIVFETKTFDSTLNGAKVLTAKNYGDYIDVTLVDAAGNVIEDIKTCTLTAGDERFIKTLIDAYSDNLVVKSINNDVTIEDLANKQFTISGGTDGIKDIDANDIITGLDNFSNPEIIDIDILATPGWSSYNVVSKGIHIAESRADCIFLIDPPFGLTAQEVSDWANGANDYETDHPAFDTSYAALYWPWVEINDDYNPASTIWLPPSAHVASQMAYSDAKSEAWFAPAGLNRGKLTKAIGLETSPTKGERDVLYGNRNVVNPIVNLRGQGIVIWGQKTCQRKPTALNRVNVRRLNNYLKKIVTESTQYFVFEPNDEYCWQKWVDTIEPKLEAIKQNRGVYDYKIVMDETTVSVDDINNHRMPGQIMYRPTKAAEFIPLSFMIMPTGAEFVEE